MTLPSPAPDNPPEEDRPGTGPGDGAPGDPAPLDAAVKRLAAIDDQLAGLATPGNAVAEDAAITPELAERLDTLLLLRMVAAGEAKAPPPLMIGKFRVIHKIGEGGFAEVFEVIDTKLVRREALKIARPQIVLDTGKKKRFIREARHAAKITHPNVVIVHEVGEHNELPYIAQELCGESLASWLERHPGPVDPAMAAGVVLALAEAAHAAHAVGVIHRDIKPGNVLLVPSDDGPLPPDDRPETRSTVGEPEGVRRQGVKLGDFGLSASIVSVDHDSPSGAPTEIGTRLGTPEWMAPEQVNPALGPMDARTDVHALGLVLDRLLTGRCVNAGPSLDSIYRRVLDVEPEPADRVVPGIHPDLVAVCSKCLAKRPGDRYQSAAELGVDLSRFLDGRPTFARPLTPAQHAGRWLRRNPTLAGAIAAALAAVVLGGLVIEERARGISREARERAEKGERDAALHLRRAFETYRIGKAEGAVNDLRKSAAADSALANSIAGGWLLARTHGEIAALIDRGEKASAENRAPLQIHAIALSPKADLLAAGVADGTLVLLPLAEDGTAAGVPREIDVGDEINQVVFSPDGEILATAGKVRGKEEGKNEESEEKKPIDVGRVRLWNVADGSHRRDVELRGSEVFSVAFSPSGDRIAWGGSDRGIRVAEVGEGKAAPIEHRPFDSPRIAAGPQDDLEVIRDAKADIELIRFFDDQRVLVAIHERVCLVDLASGRIEKSFRGDWGDIQAFTLSPDARLLMACGWHERMVRIWDVETGALQLEIEQHPERLFGCGFSPDGRQIVTGCKDGNVRTFDATTGELKQEIVGHVGRIWSTLYHPSGRIVSSAGDGTVRLWDPAVGPALLGTTLIDLPGLEMAQSTSDLGGGEWLVTPRIGEALVLSEKHSVVTRIDLGGDIEIFASAVDGSRRRIAFATNQGPIVYRFPEGGERGEPLLSPSGYATGAVEFGPEGCLYAAESIPRSSLVAWSPDLTTPRCLKGGTGNGGIDSVVVTKVPQPRLAMAKSSVITLHNLGADGAPVAGSGRLLHDFGDDLGNKLHLAWSPNGKRLAVGSIQGNAMIVDANSGKIAVELSSFAREVRGILWADNGLALIVADDRCIRLCDAVSGATLDEIRPGWAISSIAFVEGSDQRQRLAVTGSRLMIARRRDISAIGNLPDDGRLLILDLGRRLPADASEDKADGQ
ncbi:MAG: protein kinase [Planctomycetia bacterium]